MPAPAEKSPTPPQPLVDRYEGWGTLGRVIGYPEFKDDGVWGQPDQDQEIDT